MRIQFSPSLGAAPRRRSGPGQATVGRGFTAVQREKQPAGCFQPSEPAEIKRDDRNQWATILAPGIISGINAT